MTVDGDESMPANAYSSQTDPDTLGRADGAVTDNEQKTLLKSNMEKNKNHTTHNRNSFKPRYANQKRKIQAETENDSLEISQSHESLDFTSKYIYGKQNRVQSYLLGGNHPFTSNFSENSKPFSTTPKNCDQKIKLIYNRKNPFPGDSRLLPIVLEDDNFEKKIKHIRAVDTAQVRDTGYMLKIFINEVETFGLWDTGASCVIMSSNTKDRLFRLEQEYPVSPQNRFVLNANQQPLKVRGKCYIDLQFTKNGVFFYDVMCFVVEDIGYNFIIGEPIIRWIAESVGYSEVIRPDGKGTQLVIGSSLEPQEHCVVSFFGNQNPYTDIATNQLLNVQNNSNFGHRPVLQKNASAFMKGMC